jgi:hypothetical protein
MTLIEALNFIKRHKFDVYISHSVEYNWECSLTGSSDHWRHSARNRTPEEALINAAKSQPNSKKVNSRGR